MAYTESSFTTCVFNPLVKGKMTQVFPKLKEIVSPEWDSYKNIDKIIRYVIIAYDPKSPVRINERDPLKRKNIAYDLAEFERNKLGEAEDSIINQSNEVCFLFTVKYLAKFVKDKVYAALCAFEFKYYENILELMKPIVGDTNAERLDAAKKKSVISEEIIKDIKIIDELWMNLFGEKQLVEKVKTQKFIPEMM